MPVTINDSILYLIAVLGGGMHSSECFLVIITVIIIILSHELTLF